MSGMTVYVVITTRAGEIADVEVMDRRPTFGDRQGTIRVFEANINGGDSQELRFVGWA